ncbi:MAG: hypothetical protein WDO17_03855 [Alphaproteobacteria bacterium]
MPLRLLIPLVLSLVLGTAAFAAEPVFPPGSRIGLEPPSGMAAATSFQGFEDRTNRVVLLISEVSAQTYDKIAQDFTPEVIRQSGMEEISRETLPLASGEALLVVTRQEQNGTALRKWALLARSDDLTVTIIGVVPEAAREAYPDAALRAAFASVVVRAKLTPDEMLAVLPYRLDDLGGFRLLRASPDGTTVMTLGPQDTSLPAQQPYFMITPRPAEPPQPAERERFAQRMMAAFLTRPNVRVVNSEQMRIGGVPGYQIVAIGRDEGTGDELFMVQWLRFSPGVVQMFGVARRDQWDDAFTRMRAVRDGFGSK